jgi:hypothetical protein
MKTYVIGKTGRVHISELVEGDEFCFPLAPDVVFRVVKGFVPVFDHLPDDEDGGYVQGERV